jgi:DNA-binding NarL/FixJ family response regulator
MTDITCCNTVEIPYTARFSLCSHKFLRADSRYSPGFVAEVDTVYSLGAVFCTRIRLSMECGKIRVLVADDHGIMREGLSLLIGRCHDMEVVGHAGTGKEVIDILETTTPDVVLMDVKMPCGDGIETAQRALSANPSLRILAFSSEISKPILDRIVHSGANGFIMKDSVFDELAEAIRTVYGGETYFCHKSRAILMNSYMVSLHASSSAKPLLHPVDHEIIRLLSNGWPVKQIAIDMRKSPKTIDARRREIMRKLEITSMAELTKFAIRQGLTTVGQ